MPCIVRGCPPTPVRRGRRATRSPLEHTELSPASCHRATAGLTQASCGRPHLLLISVHGNESASEIVGVRFRLSWLVEWMPDREQDFYERSSPASAVLWATIVVLGARAVWVTGLRPRQRPRAGQHVVLGQCARRPARRFRWHLRGPVTRCASVLMHLEKRVLVSSFFCNHL